MTEKIAACAPAQLVWIEGTGCRPEPQILRDPFVTGGAKVLARYNLPLGADGYLALDCLAQLYPLRARAA